jgi:hypothetical protein
MAATRYSNGTRGVMGKRPHRLARPISHGPSCTHLWQRMACTTRRVCVEDSRVVRLLVLVCLLGQLDDGPWIVLTRAVGGGRRLRRGRWTWRRRGRRRGRRDVRAHDGGYAVDGAAPGEHERKEGVACASTRSGTATGTACWAVMKGVE